MTSEPVTIDAPVVSGTVTGNLLTDFPDLLPLAVAECVADPAPVTGDPTAFSPNRCSMRPSTRPPSSAFRWHLCGRACAVMSRQPGGRQ